MRQDEFSYLRKRASQEQIAARNAACPEARDRHDSLALMYRFRAAMLSGGPAEWRKCLDEERRAELA